MAAPAREWPGSERRVEGVDIAGTLAGDALARQSLVQRVHALAIAVCVRRGLDRRGTDVAPDVALRVVERVLARDLAALRCFVGADPGWTVASFERWVTVLVASAFVDHLRSQPEAIRRGTGRARRLEHVLVGELDDERVAGGETALFAIEARQLLELAARILDERQRAALILWLRGDDATEIAARLALAGGAAAANRLLHATRERLRRALREKTP